MILKQHNSAFNLNLLVLLLSLRRYDQVARSAHAVHNAAGVLSGRLRLEHDA